jgi:hypothetical protein
MCNTVMARPLPLETQNHQCFPKSTTFRQVVLHHRSQLDNVNLEHVTKYTERNYVRPLLTFVARDRAYIQ